MGSLSSLLWFRMKDFSKVNLLELKLWVFTHSELKLFVAGGIWRCATFTRSGYLHFYYLVVLELYNNMNYKGHPCRLLTNFIYTVM